MKVLIAGGAGYVGSALIPRLLERGYELVVVDLLWFGNALPEGVEVLQKNIFDLVESDLAGFDQVVFLAGLSNDPMAEFAPAENFISNAAAPAYLGYIAKRAGVQRMIYGSSCSVYGYTVDDFFDEDAPAVSNYPYGISKLQGEMSLRQMVDANFSVICLRKGTVCGYSPRMRLDLIVNTMFKTALYEGRITVNNPAIWRPLLGVHDAVGAYIRAVEAHPSISGVFNIASANYTVGEVADLVKERLESKLDHRIALEILDVKDFRNYKVNCSKATRILSFKSKQDVPDMVDDLYEHRDLFPDTENKRYYNIRVFRQLHTGGRFS